MHLKDHHGKNAILSWYLDPNYLYFLDSLSKRLNISTYNALWPLKLWVREFAGLFGEKM